MSRTILCTTGTSIAAGRPFAGDPADYQRQIRSRLTELATSLPEESDFLRQASAETNSLLNLDANVHDRVVFLTTETPDGSVCAAEASRLLEERRHIHAQLESIKGLQVGDPARFRRIGIQHLFETLDRHCGELAMDSRQKIILNVTGGFKSVVPYVTLYGLLHQLPVVYLFERSQAVLRLPPVPVNFDYERLGQALDALELLQREGVLAREQFFRAIPGLDYHGRDWYECLLEEEDGQVTASAFGNLFLKFRAQAQGQVFLSPIARRQYDASSGLGREQFTFMLERVSDPLWRKSKIHPFTGTNLTVFKPGNTSERMACVVRGSKIYVCELLQHDEYERVLPSRRAEQYQLNEFIPWVKPADLRSVPTSEEDAFRELRQRFEETFACWEKAEGQLQTCNQECTELKDAAGGLRDRASLAEQRMQELNITVADSGRRIAELTAQVSAVEAQLAHARLPWWRRLWRR